jgi:hypothetical protein
VMLEVYDDGAEKWAVVRAACSLMRNGVHAVVGPSYAQRESNSQSPDPARASCRSGDSSAGTRRSHSTSRRSAPPSSCRASRTPPRRPS